MIWNDEKYYFDAEDYEKISQIYWKPSGMGYLRHQNNLIEQDEYGVRYIYFHKYVINKTITENKVDHIDRDIHNNKKSNLRECTHQENIYNSSISKNNTSGVIGVNYNKLKGTWVASLMKNRKHVYTQNFHNKEDAIKARLLAEIKYFGKDFAPQRHLFDEYLGGE